MVLAPSRRGPAAAAAGPRRAPAAGPAPPAPPPPPPPPAQVTAGSVTGSAAVSGSRPLSSRIPYRA
jgi:hypothetical protein